MEHLGRRLPADFAAIHPYGQRPEPNWPASNWGFGYVGDLINSYRRVVDLPLLISEIGVEHLSPQEQAEYLRRFYATIAANFPTAVPDVYWFCYSDGMVPPYGLVDQTGQPKPAYHAFRQVIYPLPTISDQVMQITVRVNPADFENLRRNPWQDTLITADMEIDGAVFSGGRFGFRDASTLNFPEKSCRLLFPDGNLFNGRIRQLNLNTTYGDPSLIREWLAFDLLAAAGLPAPEAYPARLTIRARDGQTLAEGIYTALEHIDDVFFRRRQRDTGALYEATGGMVNGKFMAALLDPQPDTILKALYRQHHPGKVIARGLLVDIARKAHHLPALELADAGDSDFADLAALIAAIANLDESSAPQKLNDILDLDAYLTWLAVNTLVQNNDVYEKNYFLHRRPEDNRWEIIPWDYDLTFGRVWRESCGTLCDDRPADLPIKGGPQLANRLSRLVLTTPSLYQELRTRLVDLLSTVFAEEELFPKIDRLYEDVAALVYLKSGGWPARDRFEQARSQLKEWVRQRRRYLLKDVGTARPPHPMPDTVVLSAGLSIPAPKVGDPVFFEAEVQNIGDAPTGDTVGVAFLVDGAYITYGITAPLEAGASARLRAVSPWQAVAGEHTLTAVVDDINRYPEIREDNNRLQISFRVAAATPPAGLADVLVKDIAFTREAGNRVRLAALVHNQGQSQTGDAVGVAFFVDDRYTTFGIIPPLGPGESKAVRANESLALRGQHKITAIVDDINRFPEEREDNNILVRQIDFGGDTPETGLADAVILQVSLGQGRIAEGDPLTFEAMVKNMGQSPTGDVVGVAFFVDGQYITYGVGPALKPGEARPIRAVTPWRAAAGRHRLTALVDDINRFPEASETNNSFELDFEVLPTTALALPDSVVNDIGYELNPAGQVILTAEVSNTGTAPTPDVVGVAFFVDGQYRTFGLTNPMPPGATETIKAIQPLPLEGRHKITAIVDDINRYDEVSHQNNVLEREVNFSRSMVEWRAIWVTRYDWIAANRAPAPEKIDEIVENTAAAGFNTIFFQVRAVADAYYTPGLEPWAAPLTGTVADTLGQDPGWDPLARLLDRAHEAGLEVHAYLNVYTVWLSPASAEEGLLWPPASRPPHLFDLLTYGPEHEEHPGKYGLGYAWRQHSAPGKPMSLRRGEYLWASPGVDAVQEHILAVIADLVRRYPVDGVHLDRIRYAGPNYSFDPASVEAAGTARTPERDQWQRDRVTGLVRQVKKLVDTIRPAAWVSAAVWPYYQDKWGWGVTEGYNDYFQDSKGWLNNGLVDAIAPMLYSSAADEFSRWQILLQDFLDDRSRGQIIAGIGGDYDSFETIARRIDTARQAGAGGQAIFSYGALERRGYFKRLAGGPYSVPATLPKK
ncbi:MAG: hypothetical protein D6784_08990 [Chloroflexi bacterium]|nr:MAG: hypothetical protein D6784_08990 [Chloroflexota bacterium]